MEPCKSFGPPVQGVPKIFFLNYYFNLLLVTPFHVLEVGKKLNQNFPIYHPSLLISTLKSTLTYRSRKRSVLRGEPGCVRCRTIRGRWAFSLVQCQNAITQQRMLQKDDLFHMLFLLFVLFYVITYITFVSSFFTCSLLTITNHMELSSSQLLSTN